MDKLDLVILGSIGFDNIKTPFGEAKEILGGSALYSAFAASFFSPCGIISIKGNDLNNKELDFLSKRGISLEGIETRGETFRWTGEYKYDMNQVETLKLELNSLAGFNPSIPENYKKARFVFVANADPETQIKVINSMENPELIVIDTIHVWIKTKKEKLIEAIKLSDILILNEWEARELFETPNLVKAAKSALQFGLQAVIIKKGEHGSLLFTKKEVFNCPGYPLENVVDPTGCGDCFGGAFIGHYSKNKNIRKAMVYASVIASFNAEGFGLERIKKVGMEDIEKRYQEMKSLQEF